MQQAQLIRTGGDSGGLLSDQTLGGPTGPSQPFSDQSNGDASNQSGTSGLNSGFFTIFRGNREFLALGQHGRSGHQRRV